MDEFVGRTLKQNRDEERSGLKMRKSKGKTTYTSHSAGLPLTLLTPVTSCRTSKYFSRFNLFLEDDNALRLGLVSSLLANPSAKPDSESAQDDDDECGVNKFEEEEAAARADDEDDDIVEPPALALPPSDGGISDGSSLCTEIFVKVTSRSLYNVFIVWRSNEEEAKYVCNPIRVA